MRGPKRPVRRPLLACLQCELGVRAQWIMSRKGIATLVRRVSYFHPLSCFGCRLQ